MFVDKAIHKTILLELIKAGQFSGQHIDEIHDLKRSVENALVLPSLTAEKSTITPERAALAAHLASASD